MLTNVHTFYSVKIDSVAFFVIFFFKTINLFFILIAIVFLSVCREKTLRFLQTPERSVSRGLLSEFVSSDNLIIDVYSKPSNWPANCVGNGNVGGVNSHRQFFSDSSIISSATSTDPNMTIPTSYRSSSSSFNCCVRWTSLFSKLMRSVCTKQSANKS